MTAARRRPRVLPRSFYSRPTLEVARALLGKVLVCRSDRGITSGSIVEAEAYIGESDPACHAAAGPTRRNEPLYGEPGHAYVYFNYGMHCLVNAVTEQAGQPAAVLIRALAPVRGLELMRERRGRRRDGTAVADCDLCRGPGNLTRAMGITLDLNRVDLTGASRSDLWIEDAGTVVRNAAWSTRIGIRVGTDRLWRCFDADAPEVSAGAAAGGPVRSSPGRLRGTRSSSLREPRPR